jgi:hypothetical protein
MGRIARKLTEKRKSARLAGFFENYLITHGTSMFYDFFGAV